MQQRKRPAPLLIEPSPLLLLIITMVSNRIDKIIIIGLNLVFLVLTMQYHDEPLDERLRSAKAKMSQFQLKTYWPPFERDG